MAAYIGSYGTEMSTSLSVAFGILSVIALLCFVQTAALAHAKNHYRHTNTVRYLLPFVCLVVSIENLGMALSRFLLPKSESDNDGDIGSDRTQVQFVIIQVLTALQTTEVPILLLTTFEVCYLIHKRRSVNFCGMFFDEGHRVILVSSVVRSFVLRNLFRMLALILLATGIIVNFSLGIDDDQVSELAGKAGWFAVIEVFPNARDEAYLVLSLIPEAVLTICSLYLSIVLWRYGTSSSIVVHSTYCNPWLSPVFGTVVLLIGQVFKSNLYPFTSNLGLILFIFSNLLLMYEVDKDMDAADDFANFLKQAKVPSNTADDALPKTEDKQKENILCSPNDGIDVNHDNGNIATNKGNDMDIVPNNDIEMAHTNESL